MFCLMPYGKATTQKKKKQKNKEKQKKEFLLWLSGSESD